MASIQVRKNAKGVVTSYRVRWREQGRYGPLEYETFKTEAQAQMFKKVLELNDHDSNKAEREILAAASDSPQLTAVAELHLSLLKNIAIHTRHTYERMIINHIAPLIGHLPVDMIQDTDISEWVDAMVAKGLSPKTISNVHGFLYAVMKFAVGKEFTTTNPCTETELPPEEHTEDKNTFLTKSEVALILRHMDAYYHPFFLFLVGTGLRFSEAAALLPGDFSDNDGTYTVRITKAWKRDDKNGRKIGPPKSPRARRTVPMDKELAIAVAPQVSARALNDQVFKMHEGGQATSQSMGRVWHKARTAAQENGLRKHPRIHDLRHTYASWMLSGDNPMSMFELSRLMGHESIQTTIGTYSHLLPETLKKGASIMGSAMSGLYSVPVAPKEIKPKKPKQIAAT